MTEVTVLTPNDVIHAYSVPVYRKNREWVAIIDGIKYRSKKKKMQISINGQMIHNGITEADIEQSQKKIVKLQ